MEATLREIRIGTLKTKVAVCQVECSTLAEKSSSPYLSAEEKATIDRLKHQTISQCHGLRHMLAPYERKG
jgi:hypothetical protein